MKIKDMNFPEADNESDWNTSFESNPYGVSAISTLNKNFEKKLQKFIDRNYISKEKNQNEIEKLQKENEELKEENKTLKELHIQDNKHLDFIMKNSIPIQKIKDKIEELKNNLCTIEHYETVGAIYVLRELMEEREEK